MGDLSKNLSRHEMTCKCGCGFDTVDISLVAAIQDAVDCFEGMTRRAVILKITSGNRCQYHNLSLKRKWNSGDKIAGANTAANSQHICGRAADFQLFYRDTGAQIAAEQVADYLEGFAGLSVGRYSTRTHVDTRTQGGKRWG